MARTHAMNTEVIPPRPPLCPACSYCRLGYEVRHTAFGPREVSFPFRNQCQHPEGRQFDANALATGEAAFCTSMRAPGAACSIEGRLYEPRPVPLPPPPPPEPPPCRVMCTACGRLPPSGRHNSWLCRLIAPWNERSMRKAEERRRREEHRAKHPCPPGCQCPRCFGGAE
jgi:hypothetical protein